MKFAAKIPLMKSLRRLDLSHILLDRGEQGASLQPLLERMNDCKTLEQLSLTCQIDATELRHTMNVNRGGRRGIEVESANRCISLALWPRILHRASSIQYFVSNIGSQVERPTDKTPKAAVVFSLLRDHAHIFSHFGKTTTDKDVPIISLPASKKRKILQVSWRRSNRVYRKSYGEISFNTTAVCLLPTMMQWYNNERVNMLIPTKRLRRLLYHDPSDYQWNLNDWFNAG